MNITLRDNGKEQTMKNYSKILGCLLGGAAGDALGYSVEFSGEDTIFELYGKDGIQEYDTVRGKALISDDTQMTLFTANGLLLTENNQDYTEFITQMYTACREWLFTQISEEPEMPVTWLWNVPELHARRAPGNTCVTALRSGKIGSIDEPLNNSKGCGGVMRVAPIGLFYDPEEMDIREIDYRGAQAAALTHGHPLGYLSAAGLVHIVNKLCYDDKITIREAVEDMISFLPEFFADICPGALDEFRRLMEKAADLAAGSVPDLDAIHQLGEGWVGEEALAIAVFCAIRYQDDFDKAITVSVNHKGDSDSTGAVTGNIVGTYLGRKGIPDKYITSLEMVDVMERMAKELSGAGEYEQKGAE